MFTDMKTYSLTVSPFKETKTFFIHSTEDLYELLSDQLITLQTMLSSPFVLNFIERATQWKEKLLYVQRVLDLWLTCQKLWTYLIGIFTSEEIASELKNEAKKYEAVDQSWRKRKY